MFYDFRLEDHVLQDHLLRRIDAFLDFDDLRLTLKPVYLHIGRPSVDPELMIRMLIIGYCLGVRSERRLREEGHLNLAWLVKEKGIAPHIPVNDGSKSEDGSLSRQDFTFDPQDFTFDPEADAYTCPRGKKLTTTGRVHDGRTVLYRANKRACDACSLKPKCCPKTPSRKFPRDVNKDARDVA